MGVVLSKIVKVVGFNTKFISALFALIVLVLSFTSALAQGTWEDRQLVYSKSSLKVYISFNYSSNSCQQGGKSNKWRYEIEGSPAYHYEKLNFSFKYKNCQNIEVDQQCQFDLSNYKNPTNVEGIDNKYTGNQAYDVTKHKANSTAGNNNYDPEPTYNNNNNSSYNNNNSSYNNNSYNNQSSSSSSYTSYSSGYTGIIKDNFGNRISSAKIKYDGDREYTNAQGTFSVSTVSGKVIKVKKKGFAKYKSRVNKQSDLQIELYERKVFQLGLGFGMDLSFRPLAAVRTENGVGIPSVDEEDDLTIGFKGELVFHPYIVQNFSWGVSTSFVWGTNPEGEDDASSYSSRSVNTDFNFWEIGMGTELAFGARKFKFLGKYKLSYLNYDYTKSVRQFGVETETSQLDDKLKRDVIYAGVRLFSYLDKNGHKSVVLDLCGTFARNGEWDINTMFTGTDFQYGFNICLWAPGKIKLDFDMAFEERYANSFYRGTYDERKIFMQLGFMYNINGFF